MGSYGDAASRTSTTFLISVLKMLLTPSLFFDLFGLLVAVAAVIYSFFKWKFSYFQRKDFPFLTPSIPFGNLENPSKFTVTFGERVKELYNKVKSKNWKLGGIFFTTRPMLILTDLELVKNVLTKDFQHFVDRGLFYNEKDDPISAHLFAIGGTKWRNLRVKLTPTFTSGKMKMMFQTLVDCEENLQEKLATLVEKKQAVDIKDLVGCYTTDIIGSCAFGLECNSFKDEDSPFRKYGKKVFTSTPLRRIKITIGTNFPQIASLLKFRVFPKDVSDFFFKLVKDTVEYRQKNNYTRKDFMQLLIDLKNNKLAEAEGYRHDGNTLTMDEITAQSFVFFLAGFETSSTTMTWALYEMSKNQEIQKKVREEINTVLAKYDGKVSYDAIMEMKYMDKVLNETLRKYPPVPFITRQCVKDYKVPGEDIIIEKGLTTIVSILGIHYDKDNFPDPEKFDPERFNEENTASRHHYAHIPFGEGPRNCIGLRFGLMQSKVGLTSLLKQYNFTLNGKTRQPMKFATNSFILAADGDVWLNAKRI